jgi:hypothetical protein
MADRNLPRESPAPEAAMGAGFWAVRAAYGLGLGAMVAVLEFAHYFPLVTEGGGIGLKAFALLLAEWCGEFVVLSLVVGFARYRVRPREARAQELALAVVVGTLGGVLAWHACMDFLLRDQLGLGLFVDQVGQPVEPAGRMLYRAWLMLFFGGLAVAVEASQRRRVRMLAALRAAELARATSQQRLAEITLGSLRARIDPEFVFQTLSKLEALYEADHPGADRLLEELIAFLRAALADFQASSAAPATNEARVPGVALQLT